MTHPAYRQSAETNTTPDLFLLEFSERGSDDVSRAVLNNEDVIFEGNTFARASFGCSVPSDGDVFKAPSLTFSNVERVLGKAVLAAKGRIKCRMIHVDGGDYTVSGGVRTYYTAIQDTKDLLVISGVSADVITISGDLGSSLPMDIPYPAAKSTKAAFPGCYL